MMKNNTTPLFNLDSFEYKVNYALEASAGTGKTYNIIEIVRKLLVEYGLGLDKILIVTYTDKAAGELKNRIRELLTDSKNGKSLLEQLNGKINCDIDNASIGTIHSFCKNTIKEFAISSDQVSTHELANDDNIRNYVKKYIREGKILKEITNLLEYGQFVDEGKVVNSFVAIANLYYLDKNYKEVESIVSYVKDYTEDLIETLPFKLYISGDSNTTIKDNSPEYLECYEILENSGKQELLDFLELFSNFKDFVKNRKGIRSYGITKKNNFTSDEINAFTKLYTLGKSFEEIDIEKYLVDKYFADFYRSYQEYKEQNRLQSFSDMIRVVRELVVDNSPLLECLRNKYSYAIIDEFQDTNQIQFDIFSKIFMCKDHNIIVVGDPKQSIYAFQGADVTVYQKAVDIISKNGKKCRLGKNYRSTHAVVEFGNALFPYYEFDSEFEPSDYVSKVDKNSKERRLLYKGKYTTGLWLNREALKADEYAQFAVEQILDCTSYNESGHTNLQKEYIQNGQSTIEDVSFKDFVILARTRNEMTHIQNALKFAGIPYIRYKDDSLFIGVECADWIAILEAIYVEDFTGSNRGFFRKALFTKFFDYSINEISKDKYDSDDIEEIELFKKWRLLATNRLWQDLFDEIIIDSGIDEHMSSLTDLQSLAIYKQLANYSIDYLSKGNGLFELIRHLRSVSKFGNDEDEEEGSLIVAKSTEFNCVSIMTMHASKGLQFPVVISVGGLAGLLRDDIIDLFNYHVELEDGTKRHMISLVKPEDELAKNETIGEFKRLYYVAYTRPEFLLIAPRYKGKTDKLSEISTLMEEFIQSYEGVMIDDEDMEVPYFEFKDFNNLAYSKLKKITQGILKRNNETTDESSDYKKQKKVLLDLIQDKKNKVSYKHSYSSLAHPNKEEDNEVIDDTDIIYKEGDNSLENITYDASSIKIDGNYDPSLSQLSIPDGYPKGASMGNAIHEVFEKIDFMNYENNLDNLIIDTFKSNGFNLSNKPEWIKYTKDVVISVLNASLPMVKGNTKTDKFFKLNQISFKDRKSEIEFNFNYPNEALKNYLNGFIDLVFKRGDVYSILDWKSDTLNDNFTSYSEKDRLKAQVDERYSIQRVLYSYCLIKWLKQYYKEDEDSIFNNHFGGIYYVFVRGCNENTTNGVYVQTWNSWADLRNEFYKIVEFYGEE